jgi:hypothetical protein
MKNTPSPLSCMLDKVEIKALDIATRDLCRADANDRDLNQPDGDWRFASAAKEAARVITAVSKRISADERTYNLIDVRARMALGANVRSPNLEKRVGGLLLPMFDRVIERRFAA